MLFPRSSAWTPRQRWLIASAVVVGLVAFSSLIYVYERYYRGPSDAALFGTWQDTTPALDTVSYYRFNPDHTLEILMDGVGELSVMETGRWYAGGPNIYWRLPPDEFTPERRPIVWHIDDISPREIRVRLFRGEADTIWKRVDLPLQPKASNQALESTATR